MSFKSREKKRRAAIAVGKARSGKEKLKSRHYLTIVSQSCCCNRCGKPFARATSPSSDTSRRRSCASSALSCAAFAPALRCGGSSGARRRGDDDGPDDDRVRLRPQRSKVI